MRRGQGSVAAATGLALMVLAGCSQGDGAPRLMFAAEQHSGPDEFSIVPTRPLEMPDNLAALPEPTPAGTNRVDPVPRADVAVAMGGSAAAATRSGVPASDSALLARAGRYGVAGDIRGQLAAEDLAYREANKGRILERIFAVNVYHDAYRPLALDRYAELERWRRVGVRTPAAPPAIAQ
ncbi:DUF3035 domain-containing protein [Roseicitreum antarcticum]|uniref:Beta-barrel assembly machine subunit BamF n=1 Tax=Roseicitreum antarcticum TaxID=564137 RepID=A0A1H2SDS6_9RHOB|nr:DUF3035 domain-containing protein [Roseicitreum antarcticum]SDW29648.1 Beta-barrel assembly machine subunit BamF [Roseicitreum antarcticum]